MPPVRVGIALGSGGAKGFAHVGVLKALEEAGIQIDIVTGSSMGGLVAGFYATGMTPDFMDKFACSIRWRHWVDFTVPRLGLIAGDKVFQMVKLLTRSRSIEQADKALAIVATELLTRRRVVWKTGLIADAVRASISIPGVFVPYVHKDGIFVDGGVLDRVPVEAARELGADFVIAVDVATAPKGHAPESMMDVILQSLDMMQDFAYSQRSPTADIYIEPMLSHVGTSHFHKAREAIDAGYAAGTVAVPEILARIAAVKDASC
ncbi:MAG: patatin-like phospholipase family protein [Alicyclobacillus sp.]|nr:patatin-like phospholipase family protein [Alicyclobacillus sp.]